MLDLGASINLTPGFIYDKVNLGQLMKIGIIIRLVDCSIVYLDKVIEDPLVQVNELVFPTNFMDIT